AGGPVEARAGQDDPDRAVPVGRGHRLEQEVDRGAREVDQLRAGERDVAVRHQEVRVGLRDVGGARLDALAVDRLLDGHAGVAAEEVREQALVAWVEMLDDEDSGREASRQRADHRLQSGDAPGRGADGYGLERCLLVCREAPTQPLARGSSRASATSRRRGESGETDCRRVSERLSTRRPRSGKLSRRGARCRERGLLERPWGSPKNRGGGARGGVLRPPAIGGTFRSTGVQPPPVVLRGWLARRDKESWKRQKGPGRPLRAPSTQRSVPPASWSRSRP